MLLKKRCRNPWVTKMAQNVAVGMVQELLGGGNARRCRSREPCCALGQRKGAEESPDCAARHLRVRDSQASSFPGTRRRPLLLSLEGFGWPVAWSGGHYIRHIRLIFGNFYYFCPEARHTASRPVPVTQGRSGIQTESVTDGRQVIYQGIAELIGLTRL